MAQYAFACASRHETIVCATMGEAPSRIFCECGRVANRVYGFHFQEDRTRMFKNPVDGTTFSYSLGEQMPDNRRDYHRLLEKHNCEPVTRGTMPAQWKADQELLEHVKHGGKYEPPPKPKPSAGGPTILQQLRESKTFRVG